MRQRRDIWHGREVLHVVAFHPWRDVQARSMYDKMVMKAGCGVACHRTCGEISVRKLIADMSHACMARTWRTRKHRVGLKPSAQAPTHMRARTHVSHHVPLSGVYVPSTCRADEPCMALCVLPFRRSLGGSLQQRVPFRMIRPRFRAHIHATGRASHVDPNPTYCVRPLCGCRSCVCADHETPTLMHRPTPQRRASPSSTSTHRQRPPSSGLQAQSCLEAVSVVPHSRPITRFTFGFGRCPLVSDTWPA